MGPWVGLGWVEILKFSVGWVGLGPSVRGLGWVWSRKMDPRTTLVRLDRCQGCHLELKTLDLALFDLPSAKKNSLAPSAFF